MKKILIALMAVISTAFLSMSILAEEPEVIPNVYNPGSIIMEADRDGEFIGEISLEDYTFITTNSANYFLNDILIELKDPNYIDDSTLKIYNYTLLFMDKETTASVEKDISDPEDIFYIIRFQFHTDLDIRDIKLQHAVLENPKVTFMDGEVQYLVKEIEKGNTITPPASPTKEGYVFVGWYKDVELTEAFNLSETVTEDMTLYAKFIPATTGGILIPGTSTTLSYVTITIVAVIAVIVIIYIYKRK